MPGWRNWQTHGTQNPAVAIPCRFESDLRHQLLKFMCEDIVEQDCIFCKIIAKQLPAHIIKENDDVLVIKDRAPKATFHYLIIPKKHYKDLQEVDDCNVACSLMTMAQALATDDPTASTYRLMVNNGYDAGQRVFHLHMHFLAGSTLPDF